MGIVGLLAELGTISAEDYITARRENVDRPFFLVPRRENRVINSTAGTPRSNARPHLQPGVHAPRRPAGLDLTPGDTVEIRSAYDAVIGIVGADDDLRRGVLSISHGFGGNPGEAKTQVDGANTNRLLRTDVDYDPITGMPRMGAFQCGVGAHTGRAQGENTSGPTSPSSPPRSRFSSS